MIHGATAYGNAFTLLQASYFSKNTEDKSVPPRLYRYQQRTPVPAYLIAFLAGRICAGRIGDRSFALAEPEQLADAVAELSGVCGQYLDIAINEVLNVGVAGRAEGDEEEVDGDDEQAGMNHTV